MNYTKAWKVTFQNRTNQHTFTLPIPEVFTIHALATVLHDNWRIAGDLFAEEYRALGSNAGYRVLFTLNNIRYTLEFLRSKEAERVYKLIPAEYQPNIVKLTKGEKENV